MKFKTLFLFVTMLVSIFEMSLLVSSCSNSAEDVEPTNDPKEVSVTSKAEILDFHSANLWGYANGATGRIGFCISPSNINPTIENSKVIETDYINSDYSYYVTVKELAPSNKYFYRAFALKDGLIYYANDVKKLIIDCKGEAVDLGLSVKWASCNVGAVNSKEHGNKYAWGETWIKEEYNNKTYSESIKEKYSLRTKLRLEPIDDAAHENWGGGWRMPTKNEVQELIDNCTVTKAEIGYKIESKINKNYIIVSYGPYWTSDIRTETTNSSGFAWCWYISDDEIKLDRERYAHRYTNNYVRGVCQ